MIILINISAFHAHLAHLPLELSLGSLVYLPYGPNHLGVLLNQVSFLGYLALSHGPALAICDQLLFCETVTNKAPKGLLLIPILGFHSSLTNQRLSCRLIAFNPHIGSGFSCPLVPLIRLKLHHFKRPCLLRSRWFTH